VADDASPADQLDLEQVGRQLRRRRAQVSAEIAALTRPPEGGSAGVQFGKRVGDGTTEAISRFASVGVANDLQAISDRIDRALAKLDEGTYGTCDRCGKPIAAGRLRAAPESALCIDCARKG
jgi:RNA polymerase-binding transcription factor